MTCTNLNGLVKKDAYMNNLTINNTLDACKLVTSNRIVLNELKTTSATYSIVPTMPTTIVTFSDSLKYNADVTIEIDSRFAKPGYEIVLLAKTWTFDSDGNPFNVIFNTQYPTYYFSGCYLTPDATNDFFSACGPTNYYATDPPTYIPGRLYLTLWFTGTTWSFGLNTFNYV